MKRSELRKRSKKLAAKQAIQFADQAALCRHLPCCACNPDLYGEDLEAVLYQRADRVCDPHHTETRRTADDSRTVPLCPTCHYHCSAPGWSAKRVQREAGVDFDAVADRLHRHLTEGQQEVRRALVDGEAMYGTDHLHR